MYTSLHSIVHNVHKCRKLKCPSNKLWELDFHGEFLYYRSFLSPWHSRFMAEKLLNLAVKRHVCRYATIYVIIYLLNSGRYVINIDYQNKSCYICIYFKLTKNEWGVFGGATCKRSVAPMLLVFGHTHYFTYWTQRVWLKNWRRHAASSKSVKFRTSCSFPFKSRHRSISKDQGV